MKLCVNFHSNTTIKALCQEKASVQSCALIVINNSARQRIANLHKTQHLQVGFPTFTSTAPNTHFKSKRRAEMSRDELTSHDPFLGAARACRYTSKGNAADCGTHVNKVVCSTCTPSHLFSDCIRS